MIRLRLFAQLAERAGTREFALPAAATPEALLADRPQLGFVKSAGARVAVNRSWARWDTPIKDGDEVALLPPLTGL